MFRYLAAGGVLVLLLAWAGPIIVTASRRALRKSKELYDEAEQDTDDSAPTE